MTTTARKSFQKRCDKTKEEEKNKACYTLTMDE